MAELRSGPLEEGDLNEIDDLADDIFQNLGCGLWPICEGDQLVWDTSLLCSEHFHCVSQEIREKISAYREGSLVYAFKQSKLHPGAT